MRTTRPIAAALLTLALLGATPLPSRADEADKARIAELEREQAAMKTEMRNLRELLEVKRGERLPGPAKAPAVASPAAPAGGDRVVEVERKQNVITEEVRKLKEALVLPESQELKAQYGYGPAASKVYGVSKGVSIGGYGEFNYKNAVSDRGSSDDEFDMLRLVLYAGYKFSDRIVFNSEIEFEHGSTEDNGAVSVEFATLDYLFDEKISLRGGLVLLPMGFINEIHESPYFHGNVRPQVETQILPSTWRAGGVGFFGQLLPGLEYRTYVVTGLDAAGFSSKGIREGRQSGSEELAEDVAWVGRIDYSPVEMLTLGGSAYLGNSGQDRTFGNSVEGYTQPDVFTQIYEGHAQLKIRGFEARLLAAWINLDDAASLSRDENINPGAVDPSQADQPVSGEQFGWYGEIAYNVLPLLLPDTGHYLAPWFRYSRIETQEDVPAGYTADGLYDRDIFEVGLEYKPISQIAIKLDYRNQNADSGELTDEVRIGAGFAF